MGPRTTGTVNVGGLVPPTGYLTLQCWVYYSRCDANDIKKRIVGHQNARHPVAWPCFSGRLELVTTSLLASPILVSL